MRTLPADWVFSWEERRVGERCTEDAESDEWARAPFLTSVGIQCDGTFSCVLAAFPSCHRNKIQSLF